MNHLQYTSKEMYSSTDLIRKSKSIFDKLNNKEIEKAVILRDGKPSFMLLDFETYENIMIEYVKLKEASNSKSTKKLPIQENTHEQNTDKRKEENSIEAKIELIEASNSSNEELNEAEVQKALEEIEKLNFNSIDNNTNETKKEQPLKDFWE